MKAMRGLALLALALPFAAAASEPAARHGAPAPGRGRLPAAGERGRRAALRRLSRSAPGAELGGAGAGVARGPASSQHDRRRGRQRPQFRRRLHARGLGLRQCLHPGGDRRGAHRPGLLPSPAAPDRHRPCRQLGRRPGAALSRPALLPRQPAARGRRPQRRPARAPAISNGRAPPCAKSRSRPAPAHHR